MIWAALILLLVGIALSAFFSGSETGFYRASRVRLVMDALEDDATAKRLLFFANRPPLFVATSLIGNNAANYLTSLSIVLGSKALLGAGATMEMLASICFSPVIFVYGELLPKHMFFQAPNRLLRRSTSFFSLCAALFAPISAVLWALGRLLELMLGQSPSQVRVALAKKELADVLAEGQDMGILNRSQLTLAQDFFLVASTEVRRATRPVSKIMTIASDIDVSSALQIARRQKLTEIPVTDKRTGELAGYIRTIELLVDSTASSISRAICPLVEIHQSDLFGEAIMRLQAARELMARVVDDDGNTVGVVSMDDLMSRLFG